MKNIIIFCLLIFALFGKGNIIVKNSENVVIVVSSDKKIDFEKKIPVQVEVEKNIPVNAKIEGGVLKNEVEN